MSPLFSTFTKALQEFAGLLSLKLLYAKTKLNPTAWKGEALENNASVLRVPGRMNKVYTRV